MATRKSSESKKPETQESKETTFRCRVCDQPKPVDEMMMVTRFFPPLIVCRKCEKKMR